MPSYLTAPRSRPGPRRRSLLTGAAGVASAALLTGCSDSAGSADERPSAEQRLRAGAAKDSRLLLGRYDAVLAAHPSLAERLRPLRDEVQRHVEAFTSDRAPSPATAAPSTAATPQSPSATPSAPAPSAAADPEEAVRDLARAERDLADRRAEALLDAPAEHGRLLASVAAAGAAHAFLLTDPEDDK
ncbi:hypothetical protein [Streptomyces sp. NPDC002564]|uniref:hypothetical protein n=1 Tax=Streptomyces sp. NPDC002564 TaxID=3364649 RepID=UPI0036A5C193